ncbi:hypothetical protein INT43_005680 [Umbelopsis isabellina]|uniref:Uncharacterized protein n=1 Tax=Mortierella isabellina TaxID=91625 RepID=A0A8H7PMG1_MORIS|nr:hypothetical protein INT43_005680 [Umbelopsis isabellina]
MSTSKKEQPKPLAKEQPNSQIKNNQAEPQEPSPAVEKALQSVWFGGHATTLVATVMYLVSMALFRTNRLFYVIAYLGIITSYSVIVYRTFGVSVKYFGLPKPHQPYFTRLLIDENATYLFLAIYWIISKPLAITLVPYTIYAVFHMASFAQVNLLHKNPDAQRKIKQNNEKHYDRAMLLAAEVEIFGVMGRLIIGLFMFKTSLFAVFLFAHFLRLRYHMNENSRKVFSGVASKLDNLLLPQKGQKKKVPPAVQKAYNKVKVLMSRYGSTPIERKAM